MTALQRHDEEIRIKTIQFYKAIKNNKWYVAYDIEKHIHSLIKERRLYLKLRKENNKNDKNI